MFIPVSASAKGTQFWNLTANTITSLQFSPTGKNEWGRNQADNDKDHTVDHDERLKITDTASGAYDVKIVDKSGRVAVELSKDAGDPLSIALPNETYSIHVVNSGGSGTLTVTGGGSFSGTITGATTALTVAGASQTLTLSGATVTGDAPMCRRNNRRS